MDLIVFAGQIAAQLGDGWHGTPGDHDDGVFVKGPDGEALHLRNGFRSGDGDRIYIRGSLGGLHDHLPCGVRSKEVSVSDTKSARQIARDIERRLLPEYRDALTLARKRKQESDADDARAAQLVTKLIAALGPDARYIEHSRAVVSGSYGQNKCDVDVRPGRSHVEFTVHMKVAKAVELAAFIRALR